MSNVSKGHGFEREVKKLFTDAGWFCTRAAASQSPMDLIAYCNIYETHPPMGTVLSKDGYVCRLSKSIKIPVGFVWSKKGPLYNRRIYEDTIVGDKWCIVLMQCKINRRRLKK